MKTHPFGRTLRIYAAALILALSAVNTTHAASVFGFNYWPAGYSCNVLTNANWTVMNQMSVQSDLDQMSSLGADVLRLMFWPQLSGYSLEGGGGPGGATFTSDFTEERSNLVNLLSYCSSRGIKVIITFGNNYLGAYDSQGQPWWMGFYGNTTAGFTNFLADTQYWVNGFVNTIEASPYASTILYYDYQNVYSRFDPNMQWYLRFLYDWSTIPSGKRGCSVRDVDDTFPYAGDDVQALKVALDGRTLNFVDYHSYPATPHNPNIEQCYDSVKNRFGTTTVLLGEFGRESTEQNQQATIVDVSTRARNKNIPYHLHWMFLDNAIFTNIFGWAYTSHDPKHVMGGMSSLNGAIYNSDAEIVTSGRPAGWAAGSSGSITFTSMGPNASNAAANNYYARIQCNTANALVWMNSPSFTVTGGTKLSTNCFFRCSMTNVWMTVNQYDSNWGVIPPATSGPQNTPSGWSWNNYLGRVGSWSTQLNANTHYVIVSVVGQAPAVTPSYLDVDIVSGHTR